jgi:gliding motility-associated-like protein
VNSTPTITSVTNSGPVCSGTPLSFSVNVAPTAPVGGSAGYNWSGPGFSSNVPTPTIATSNPNNTGVYTLSVTNTFTNGGSCVSFSSTSAFVVPVAQVAVAPTTATICQNANHAITANAPQAANSYSWTGPGFTAGTQNISLTNVSPLNSGNYSVTAYFTSPGTTLVCSSTAVSNLSVVPRNPVVVAVSNNVCQHTTGTISATAVGAYAYSWTGPNNFTSNTATAAINNIQPVSAGAYNVTAYFSIGTVTCTTTNVDQINVVPVNPVTVNPPVSVCYPSNVALQASSPGALTYSWSGPASYTSNVANPVLYVPTTTATGVFTVTTSYNNGILTCYNSNTVGVTVNPILTFTLPSFQRICYNTLFNVDGPAGATSYTWTSSSGYTSNSEDLNIPGIQPNQSGTYTLSLNLGPCITKAATQVEVVTPIQFTLTPNSRTICLGDSVDLVMGSTGGSQNYAYQWNPPVFIGSPTGSVAVGVPLGTTIYQVTGYDIACPQYSITHSFTVQVNQAPKPDLMLEKNHGCQPLTIFYDGKTKQDAAITTYDFGGIHKVQADSFWYTLHDPGVYHLKISTKGKNGCFATYEYPAPITVYPKPHSDVIFNPETPSTTNNQVTFNPTHKYGPVVSHEWMFQGASGSSSYDTSSVTNPFRIYDEVGKYPVMLISKTDMGCIDTVFKILDIRDEMTVYIPNTFTPNNDNLNDIFSVKGIGLKMEGYSMEIFDRWGTLVYFTRDILKGWDGTVKGQMAENGVYIYKIKIIGANGEGKKEYIGHVTLLK